MDGQDASQPQEGGQIEIQRLYEQSPDALSMYSEIAHIVGTRNEVIIQFYETIPGIPGPSGAAETMTTRLKATITMSFAHAANLGRILLERIPEEHRQGNTQ